MIASDMIERFDKLVDDDIAFYDADQQIVEHEEAGLKVRIV